MKEGIDGFPLGIACEMRQEGIFRLRGAVPEVRPRYKFYIASFFCQVSTIDIGLRLPVKTCMINKKSNLEPAPVSILTLQF